MSTDHLEFSFAVNCCEVWILSVEIGPNSGGCPGHSNFFGSRTRHALLERFKMDTSKLKLCCLFHSSSV